MPSSKILKCNKCNKRFNVQGIEEGTICTAEAAAKDDLGEATGVICGGSLVAFDARTHDRMQRKSDGAA